MCLVYNLCLCSGSKCYIINFFRVLILLSVNYIYICKNFLKNQVDFSEKQNNTHVLSVYK